MTKLINMNEYNKQLDLDYWCGYCEARSTARVKRTSKKRVYWVYGDKLHLLQLSQVIGGFVKNQRGLYYVQIHTLPKFIETNTDYIRGWVDGAYSDYTQGQLTLTHKHLRHVLNLISDLIPPVDTRAQRISPHRLSRTFSVRDTELIRQALYTEGETVNRENKLWKL